MHVPETSSKLRVEVPELTLHIIVSGEVRNHRFEWATECKYLPSTLLISPAPKPVKVRLCFGRAMPAGPTGPWRSEIGALVEGRRSRGTVEFDIAAAFLDFSNSGE
jgi:hypothetical protein